MHNFSIPPECVVNELTLYEKLILHCQCLQEQANPLLGKFSLPDAR